jgi:hypothetical protein
MITPFNVEPESLRDAIAQACEITSTTNDPGKVADALVTFSQARALDFRTAIVRGGRGSGKSFWWAALQRAEHRNWIVRTLGAKLSKAENLEVYAGFGVSSDSDKFPSWRVLEELAKSHSDHLEDIWMAVLLNHVVPAEVSPFASCTNWRARVEWVAAHVEEAESHLRDVVRNLEEHGRHVLIAFDALDRLASTWQEIRPLAKSILRFALGLQSHSRIRAKVFLRPDMLEDTQITAFPDASKLLDSQAKLDWSRIDLFALFFQRLGNAEDSAAANAFRIGTGRICQDCGFLTDEWSQQNGVWAVPKSLRSDDKAQKEIFHALSGRAMSHNQGNVKRGYPYTWLPNHLADSHDEISPRSFLAALREAARHQGPHGSELSLYFTGIQKGVAKASETRVTEITEDYPWVHIAMDPLRSQINVPCNRKEIIDLWENGNVEQSMRNTSSADAEGQSPKLGPPKFLSFGLLGLLDDLIRLGIFSEQKGDRIQMPDVYRVAFGLGRRGGIPPMRPQSA